ncbi:MULTISPECIES: zinc ribbon domain-containing protein [unclassified Streptomyces]|uniref:Zinc ribbon domain-containing protein n=1 Tax=Streptomyces johnsoniae TaxID=3075532 RepID=A0ABU2S6B3_9ACTN|nr:MULTISPECIES: zinc ribbon domain-containing protein [unclassified Streptomyces]MDT0444508.1 zinc ribbon domain-containing protein [Streptomyces sp. DSM 41886]ONK10019.1 hypothetical protein STBA_07250 [Streptomyces sp. MP131-18]
MGQRAMRVFVGNQQVHCPFCRYHLFNRHDIKLDGGGMSFLGLDWDSRSATGLICGQCGYVQMFCEPRLRVEAA